jgi:hypothetical protein
MKSQLSRRFVKHVEKVEKCVNDTDLGGAEAHRLIPESIHGALATFEVINE